MSREFIPPDDPIEFSPELVTDLAEEIESEKLSHFIFWTGPDDIYLDSEDRRKYGVKIIKRGRITAIPLTYYYWDRIQEDAPSADMIMHPDRKKRKNDTARNMRPGKTAKYFQRQYGEKGLKIIKGLTGKPNAAAIACAKKLITKVGKSDANLAVARRAAIPYDEMRAMIKAGQESESYDSIIFLVAEEFLEAMDLGEAGCREDLASKVGEMKDRANGQDGIARLDELAYHEIRLLGQTAADYEIDSNAVQQALQKLVIGGNMPSMGGSAMDAIVQTLLKQQEQMMKLTEMVMTKFGTSPVEQEEVKPSPYKPTQDWPDEDQDLEEKLATEEKPEPIPESLEGIIETPPTKTQRKKKEEKEE